MVLNSDIFHSTSNSRYKIKKIVHFCRQRMVSTLFLSLAPSLPSHLSAVVSRSLFHTRTISRISLLFLHFVNFQISLKTHPHFQTKGAFFRQNTYCIITAKKSPDCVVGDWTSEDNIESISDLNSDHFVGKLKKSKDEWIGIFESHRP
jgi:hypothetical protein